MLKKIGKFFFGLFKVLLVLFLIFSLVYLSISVFNTKVDNKFQLYIGNFAKAAPWLSDWNDTSIDDIYAKLGENNDNIIAAEIYTKACEKLMLVPAYGVRAISTIVAVSGGIQVDVANNRTEQYRAAGTPTLNANQKIYSSYTNTIYVTEVNNEVIGAILKGAIQFADRGYSDGTAKYKQKGKLSVMDDDGEVITWATEYAPEEASAERVYRDDEIREKGNYIINADTIMPGSVEIEREFDEDVGMYLYKIAFNLDCSTHEEGSATYYEAKAVGDVLGGFMESLIYNYMKVEMTMYSNGYFMTFDSAQEWTLTFSVGSLLRLAGTATNTRSEVLSYDSRDCEVVNFTAK